jgi:hypothetical protein
VISLHHLVQQLDDVCRCQLGEKGRIESDGVEYDADDEVQAVGFYAWPRKLLLEFKKTGKRRGGGGDRGGDGRRDKGSFLNVD